MKRESEENREYTEQRYRNYQANWYAINTNPRCENVVYSILRKQSFEVFLPEIPKNSGSRAVKALFPGYLFARLNLNSDDWVKINYLHGVRRILSFGSNPVPVPDEVIVSIMQNTRNGGFTRESTLFKDGDRVKLIKGPLEGLEGIFRGKASGKERVKVLLMAIHDWAFTLEVSVSKLSKSY